MKNGRNKINEMITERMIERIQTTGELPWHKPWVSQNARAAQLDQSQALPRSECIPSAYDGLCAAVFPDDEAGEQSRWSCAEGRKVDAGDFLEVRGCGQE